MVIKSLLVSNVSSAFKLLAQERICLSNSAVKILTSYIFKSSIVLSLSTSQSCNRCAHTLVAEGKLRSEDLLYIIRCSEQFEQVYSIRWNVKLLQSPWLHIHITMSNNNSKLSENQTTGKSSRNVDRKR